MSEALYRAHRQVVQATDAEVGRLRDRAEQVAQMRRRAVRRLDPTPTRLGQRLDPLLVRTPALDLIDREMMLVRNAVDVMVERRTRFAILANQGAPADEAAATAAREVVQSGNPRLLLSMPPQEGKTTAVSRYGVLWLLRQFPDLRVVIVSFDGTNASRISYQSRGDIELFDGSAGNHDLGLRLQRDQKAVSRWRLTSGGEVYAIGVGGGLTGRPVDLLLVDDPVKDDQAASSAITSSRAWLWWMGVGRPRLAPDAPVIVVGTRWHEADLIGRLQAKQAEDEQAGLAHYDRWRTLAIPAQADHDPARGESDPLGREPGEFMASARGRTREQWEATKAATALRQWSALYQCRPSPEVGNVWQRPWWRRYTEPAWTDHGDGTFRVKADRLIASWDMAFKDEASSDYVVGQVWARRGADALLVYSVWARLDFPSTLDAVVRVHNLFPEARPILVEDAANGPAVIASLKKVVPGLVPVKVAGKGKVARAEAVSPFLRSGNVQVPNMEVALMDPRLTWDPDALIGEATAFPFGAHDDQVDAASQALAELFLGPSPVVSILTPRGRIPAMNGNGQIGENQLRLNQRRTTRRL